MLDPKQLEQAVQDAYLVSENEMGWRLLASPQNVLFGADVAFIGMNPGGVEEISGHGEFAMARGSAYVDEVWPGWAKGASPLQMQVRKLFDYLDQSPENVLAGNFVPFRSPNWASLKNKRASLDFGGTLWQQILESAKPKLIVGMGGPIAGPLSKMLNIRHLDAVDVGWGNVKGRFGSNRTTRLVILPHLSRFAIIGRPESAQGLEALFGPTWGRGFRS